MSLPLLDGQGNFGSMDGDSAAAMLYRVRMAKAANYLLMDIERDTVGFRTTTTAGPRPTVLPGAASTCWSTARGIAVGMATNIPPITWAGSSMPPLR